MIDEDMIKKLCREALRVRDMAYMPYSGFAVGAALISDGKIFSGCNVENASYGASSCAERNAVFSAAGALKELSIEGVAIAGGKAKEVPSEYVMPCGICRQVLSEFASDDMIIISVKSEDDYKIFSMKELLPLGFTLKAD